jgi:iron(III) transport system substrate-binding protein
MMRAFVVVGLAALLTLPVGAAAQGSLNVYCSVQAEWCQGIATEFQRQTGVKVAITQKGSGETLAQVAAEAANPKGDAWFGGTGDPHLQAAEQNLTQQYKSPNVDKLHDWARRQAEQSGFKTVGIYAGALGFAYNPELLQKRKVAPPACWKDLLKAEYKDEIQVANPNSSGTAYTAIATLVQLFGEEEAFRYLKQLHKNVNQYPRSGTGPVKAVARGETSVGISFLHDGVTEAVAGFPVKIHAPCEGTGYEIGSLSIIKGARNLDNAKKFADWALTAPAQKIGADNKQFQVPSNMEAKLPPQAPKFAEIKLINYDFAKYGSKAERKRLIDRWEKEVNSQPK